MFRQQRYLTKKCICLGSKTTLNMYVYVQVAKCLTKIYMCLGIKIPHEKKEEKTKTNKEKKETNDKKRRKEKNKCVHFLVDL